MASYTKPLKTVCDIQPITFKVVRGRASPIGRPEQSQDYLTIEFETENRAKGELTFYGDEITALANDLKVQFPGIF